MLDLIIRGGKIIDGSGTQARSADIGIANERIAVIGTLENRDAQQIIDATGRYVVPGFIDIHAHTDESIFLTPLMESKVFQGVTTEVTGNCGSSAAPLLGEAVANMNSRLERYGDFPLTWSRMGEYLDRVEELRISANYVTLVGHGTLRACVMGYDMRPPTRDELCKMRTLLDQSLAEGAWGMSTGLIYPPSSYAKLDELVDLSRAVADRGRICSTHIRDEGDHLLEALEEALSIGQKANVRIQLSHHKVTRKHNWGKVSQSVARINRAHSEGLEVSADQYPYVASNTGLAAFVPDWAHEGGKQKLVDRLTTRSIRERIGAELREERPGWDDPNAESIWHNIVVSDTRNDRSIQGKTLWQIAQLWNKDPIETAFDLLISNTGAVQIIIFNMAEEDVQFVMKVPWVYVGSDATARAPRGPLSEALCHPRNYGTFPRVLGRYVRELGVLTWEAAISKMTGGPASVLGLDRRGWLKEGYFADIVVFDPVVVNDSASFAEPNRFPVGIDYVIINGTITVANNHHTGARTGQVLRNK